jgi:hypothetical protein
MEMHGTRNALCFCCHRIERLDPKDLHHPDPAIPLQPVTDYNDPGRGAATPANSDPHGSATAVNMNQGRQNAWIDSSSTRLLVNNCNKLPCNRAATTFFHCKMKVSSFNREDLPDAEGR